MELILAAYFAGKATPFRHGMLQIAGIVLAFVVAEASCLLCAALGVNLLVAILVPAFCFLAVYAAAGEVVDKDYGNLLVDIVCSLSLGAYAGVLYQHPNLITGRRQEMK